MLFKKFADLDAFDLEVNCDDPVKLVDMLVALEPTFGGVNLEDIKVRMQAAVYEDDRRKGHSAQTAEPLATAAWGRTSAFVISYRSCCLKCSTHHAVLLRVLTLVCCAGS